MVRYSPALAQLEETAASVLGEFGPRALDLAADFLLGIHLIFLHLGFLSPETFFTLLIHVWICPQLMSSKNQSPSETRPFDR